MQIKLSRQIGIQVWLLSLVLSLGAYFIVVTFPDRPKEALFLEGDTLAGVLLQTESNGFSKVIGNLIFLTASGRVFSLNLNTQKEYVYHGKVPFNSVEKIKSLILEYDIRLQTYQDMKLDGSFISLALYFKSKRIVSKSLYGDSRNENFSKTYRAIENLVKPILSESVEMTEADIYDLRNTFLLDETSKYHLR